MKCNTKYMYCKWSLLLLLETAKIFHTLTKHQFNLREKGQFKARQSRIKQFGETHRAPQLNSCIFLTKIRLNKTTDFIQTVLIKLSWFVLDSLAPHRWYK